MMIAKKTVLGLLLSLISTMAMAQKEEAYVDDEGVMRWGDSNEEIYGFGVNYTAPFAHAYRSAAQQGISINEAIDQDVYHMARLGFDAYRVHVWDTEISDSLGNLLENEHLEAFDYMINQMKRRGMRFLITPIAFWGNGWPEPDSKTPGFSSKFGKDGCLTDETAIKAQENYLAQFLNHINPFTGLAYKEDVSVVAVEISNEPHHRQSADSVTRYVKKMVSAVRSTGCEKPVFYNISHSIHLVDAYFDGEIQGGTFQWYPTGLGAGEELQGNLLPNVDRYEIPFADNVQFAGGAKVVYEFDAADVGRSYMYPAMARSFRTAGIQWATQFAYDPTFLAYANTEYNTHYMNLVYTPQKALSLKIAGEVFHKVPRYKDFGRYPDNARFDDFRVSYEEDLAEMVSDTEFFYSNHTTSIPPKPAHLKTVAGYGHSEVVQYDGTGAYFLDQLEKGVWRLEVLPDAIWVDDPFGQNSLKRTLAEIVWNEWPMVIQLPDLGEDFAVSPMNDGNEWTPVVKGTRFVINPGTYLITRKGKKTKVSADQQWKNIKLGEYAAPQPTIEKTYVLHTPVSPVSAKDSYMVEATVIAPKQPDAVVVYAYAGYELKRYEMQQTGYEYKVEIPAEDIRTAVYRYYIVLETAAGLFTYPSGEFGQPGDWDFEYLKSFQTHVLESEAPIYLFDAYTDNDEFWRGWSPKSSFVPLAEPNRAEVHTVVEKLFVVDPENPHATPVYDYSMRYGFNDKIEGRREDLEQMTQLVFRGRSLLEKPAKIQVALVTDDGQTYGAVLELEPGIQEYRIPLEALKEVRLVTLPRPYPSFLPYYFERAQQVGLDVNKVEVLQLSIGPGLSDREKLEEQGFAVESIRLE